MLRDGTVLRSSVVIIALALVNMYVKSLWMFECT